MDALNAQNLKSTLVLQEKPIETSEKDCNKMNWTACDIIRSYLTQDIKYHVMNKTFARNIWEILKSKYLTKSIENRLPLKKRLYHFQLKKKNLHWLLHE